MSFFAIIQLILTLQIKKQTTLFNITNIVTHGQLHYGYTVFLFTCSASAASPPRITDASAWSVTDTILTRWDTNS